MGAIRIESLDDPRLDVFRNLKQTNRTRYDSLFVVEGATVAERLFRSDYVVHSVLLTESRLAEFHESVPSSTPIYVVEKALASQLVGFKFHLGLLASAERKTPRPLADVLPPVGPSLVLVGDQIIDQQNVGMLIRIGSAFGAGAVVFGAGSADPFSRRVMRVSMGNGLFMPVLRSVDTCTLLAELESSGYVSHATVLDVDATELNEYEFPERSALVFGNESHGLSEDVISRCGQRLTISMLNGTDSVNIAIAAGIFSHAYRSQH